MCFDVWFVVLVNCDDMLMLWFDCGVYWVILYYCFVVGVDSVNLCFLFYFGYVGFIG